MKKIVKTAFLAALLLFPGHAWATGDLGCEINDGNLKFDYVTLVNRSMRLFLGGDVRFESAKAEIPAPLQKLDQGKLQLVHSWYDDREIRLMLYAEHQDDKVDFASIRLTIVAALDENDDYVGTYRLEVEGTRNVVVTGKTSCLVG
jgi:hypothetical protein